MFLYEQMVLFKIRALKEGRPFQLVSTPKFLNTFIKNDFLYQNFLCELFLHEIEFPMDVHSNLDPHLGDIQIREFTSFFTNNMHWFSAIQTIQKNEETSTFKVQSEPQYPTSLRIRHMRQLQSP